MNPPSHQQTAQTVGISPSKVSEVRAVMSDPEARQEVERGKISIHRAAQEARERKKTEKESKPRATFTRQTGEGIEWAGTKKIS